MVGDPISRFVVTIRRELARKLYSAGDLLHELGRVVRPAAPVPCKSNDEIDEESSG